MMIDGIPAPGPSILPKGHYWLTLLVHLGTVRTIYLFGFASAAKKKILMFFGVEDLGKQIETGSTGFFGSPKSRKSECHSNSWS